MRAKLTRNGKVTTGRGQVPCRWLCLGSQPVAHIQRIADNLNMLGVERIIGDSGRLESIVGAPWYLLDIEETETQTSEDIIGGLPCRVTEGDTKRILCRITDHARHVDITGVGLCRS